MDADHGHVIFRSPMDLDFEMLPESPASPAVERAVVVLQHGDRLVAATVEWYRASGSVFMTVESDGGLGFPTSRVVLQRALTDADRYAPVDAKHGYLLQHGPKFTDGRAFAVRLSKATRTGSAHFYQ